MICQRMGCERQASGIWFARSQEIPYRVELCHEHGGERLPEACPYWADGEHCYEPVNDDSPEAVARFFAGVDRHIAKVSKRCACGKTVERLTDPPRKAG